MNTDNAANCQLEQNDSNGPSQPKFKPRRSSINQVEIEFIDEMNEEVERKKSITMQMQDSHSKTAAGDDQNSEYSSESEHSDADQ